MATILPDRLNAGIGGPARVAPGLKAGLSVGRRPARLEALEDRMLLSATWVDSTPDLSAEPLTADDLVIEAEVQPVRTASIEASVPVMSSLLPAALHDAAVVTLPDEAVGRYRVSGTARATPNVVPAQRFSTGLRVTQNGVVLGNLPSKIFGVKVTHNTVPSTVPFVSHRAGKYRFKATGTVDLRGYGERVTVQVRVGGKVFEKNNKWKIAGQIVAQANVRGIDIEIKAPARGRWFRAL